MEIVLRVTAGPHSGQEYVIDRHDTYTVGRSSRAHFPAHLDLMLSREHFKLESQIPLCYLIDLGSTNGTKVNGLRVERVLLREGDIIQAGDSSFIVHFAEDTGAQNYAICAGCGVQIPIKSPACGSLTEIASGADGKDVRLCDECEARRLKFPKTDPD